VEAHTALASYYYRVDWNFAESEKEFKKALELDADYSLAHNRYAAMLSFSGRHDQALRESRLALQLEPYLPINHFRLQWVLMMSGRYEESLKHADTSLGLFPDHLVPQWQSAIALTMMGKNQEAVEEIEKVIAASDFEIDLAAAGYIYAVSEKRGKSLEILKRLLNKKKVRDQHTSSYYVAQVYAGLGNNGEAFKWLERGYQSREGFMFFIKIDPFFRDLHDDPRFSSLVQRIGFPKNG